MQHPERFIECGTYFLADNSGEWVKLWNPAISISGEFFTGEVNDCEWLDSQDSIIAINIVIFVNLALITFWVNMLILHHFSNDVGEFERISNL